MSHLPTCEVLQRVSDTLVARRTASPETSYTAQLFSKGTDAILRKIGEESTELILAGKDGKQLQIVREATDVVYHVMVLLAYHDLSIEDVLLEFRRREGISGIDEKKSRGA